MSGETNPPSCGWHARPSGHGSHDHAAHHGAPPPVAAHVVYTCPMHPQIRRDAPGSCPICGMALEPLQPTTESPHSAELRDMSRRFWIGALLAAPLVIREMSAHLGGGVAHHEPPSPVFNWIELALATPVVWWAGWPFWVRAGA